MQPLHARPARLGRLQADRRSLRPAGADVRQSTNSLLRNLGWARKAILSFSYAPLELITWIALTTVGVSRRSRSLPRSGSGLRRPDARAEGLHDPHPAHPLPRRHPAPLPGHHRLVPRAHLRRGQTTAPVRRGERHQPSARARQRRPDPSASSDPPDGDIRLPTRCAICGRRTTPTSSTRPTSDAEDFSTASLLRAAVPDRVHYRMVRCRRCGLVRSDPVADTTSSPSSTRAADSITRPRCRNLTTRTAGISPSSTASAAAGSPARDRLRQRVLSRGGQRHGYAVVRGVEPSADAVAQAPPSIREGSSSTSCAPGSSRRSLRRDLPLPGPRPPSRTPPRCSASACACSGRAASSCLNHDVGAPSPRVSCASAARSSTSSTPISSAAHTIGQLFEKQGYRVLACSGVRNTYSLRYLAHLPAATPAASRPGSRAFLDGLRLGSRRLNVRLGNLYVIAQRPIEART